MGVDSQQDKVSVDKQSTNKASVVDLQREKVSTVERQRKSNTGRLVR
jgi:hypothetical protein